MGEGVCEGRKAYVWGRCVRGGEHMCGGRCVEGRRAYVWRNSV